MTNTKKTNESKFQNEHRKAVEKVTEEEEEELLAVHENERSD